jgi:NitT/TauT family transport system substrate-binding protein
MNARTIFTVCAVLLTAVSLLPSAADAQKREPAKIRMGGVPVGDTMPVQVGISQGFFKEEGIEMEFVPNSGGAVGIPALEGGSLELQYADVVSVMRAIDRGLKLKLLAAGGTYGIEPNRDAAHVLVLTDSGIDKPAALKGKRVAVNLFGNIQHLYMVAFLDQAGLKPADYTITELPFPQMMNAVLNKQVDAAGVTDPFRSITMNTGKVREIGSHISQSHRNVRTAGYVAVERWVNANPDLARAFQRAYAKSVDFVNKHPEKHGDWQVQYFKLPAALKDQVFLGPFLDRDLGPEVMQSLTHTRDIMARYGFLKSRLDPQTIVFK